MSHKPGEWWVLDARTADGEGEFHVLIGDQEYRVCSVLIGDCAGHEEANARLIAAAPDLLAACGHLLWLLEIQHGIDTGHIGRDAKAAIAKAKGESK